MIENRGELWNLLDKKDQEAGERDREIDICNNELKVETDLKQVIYGGRYPNKNGICLSNFISFFFFFGYFQKRKTEAVNRRRPQGFRNVEANYDFAPYFSVYYSPSLFRLEISRSRSWISFLIYFVDLFNFVGKYGQVLYEY